MYAVLAGGVGAARFLRGLVRVVDPTELVVIVNVGDDLELHGLRVCPDLDTLTYTLAGLVDPQRGWGRADETFTVAEELRRHGEPTWFALGDRDLGLHLARTRRLRAGWSLSEITREVTAALDVDVTLLPATDDRVETRVRTRDGRLLHFQEYWVRERAEPEVEEVLLDGRDDATPAPGVLEAIADADAVLVCPSNPVVSVGTILAVPGIHETVTATAAPVVGVSPIIGGAVVRGMADRLLPAVGVEVSAVGVARLYRDWLDGWVIDQQDAALEGPVRELGIEVAVTDTLMDEVAVAAALARTTLELAGRLR